MLEDKNKARARFTAILLKYTSINHISEGDESRIPSENKNSHISKLIYLYIIKLLPNSIYFNKKGGSSFDNRN